jgi:K+-sensing histidine kinase KdpD
MKAQLFSPRSTSQRPLTLTPNALRLSDNISMHDLVNQLLPGLQPLAIKRNNVILNGIHRDLSIVADVNLLARELWNLINSAVSSTKNECIHIMALVKDERTMICVKKPGANFYHTIFPA